MMNDHATPTNEVGRLLEKGLRKFIEEEYDRCAKDAAERVERLKGEVVAGMMITLMKTANMQVLQDKLIITIQTKTQ
jgi:hypothetical protein